MKEAKGNKIAHYLSQETPFIIRWRCDHAISIYCNFNPMVIEECLPLLSHPARERRHIFRITKYSRFIWSEMK